MPVGALVTVEDFNLGEFFNFRNVESLFRERLNGRVVVDRFDREEVTEETEFRACESIDGVLLLTSWISSYVRFSLQS